jgi:hypothetical protein
MLPEAAFAQQPYNLGQSVHLTWQAQHALRA